MRRSLYVFLPVAMVLFAVVSCKQPPRRLPGTPELKLSRQSVSIGYQSRKVTFDVISDVAWTLSTDEGWITPDATGRKAGGTTTVSLDIAKNDSGTRRQGYVTISAPDIDKTREFIIIQGDASETDFSNRLSGVNLEIYLQMREWYYWNDAVRTADDVPDDSSAPADFLEEFIKSLDPKKVQDTSNGEDPPTIDGLWNAAHTERTQIYSYIKQTGGPTRAASSETTFGLGFVPLSRKFDRKMDSQSDLRYFLITWVQPGGPAYDVGIRRGTVMTKYNGQDITYDHAYVPFFYQVYYTQGDRSLTLTDTKGNTYDLTQRTMKVSPVIANKMILSPKGKNVAYFAYSSFAPGDKREFDNEMRNVFAGFRGADELVLDLRYNGGGAVYSSQLLSSLAGDVSSSMVFGKLLYDGHTAQVRDGENPELIYFLDEGGSLKLNRVYVLGTKSTASASEMVISSLLGADVDVVLIGAETNGKNVGMDGFMIKDGGRTYEFRPITFKILNSNDFCDYAGGFKPTYAIDELRGINSYDGSGIRELGDPQEELLNAALTHIDGGSPRVDGARYAAGIEGADFPGKLYPPVKGAYNHTFEMRGGKWEQIQ